MKSISDSEWDLVIAGTGLPQSLLALALSRSDKKILHVDRNAYYGGEDAALSLQDAEEWVKLVAQGSSRFRDARISKFQSSQSSIGFSRAYSLSLSPQIVYARSSLLPTLVSSKVYRQLEFLAVGAWWIYEKDYGHDENNKSKEGRLKKIPGGREDIFADKTIDLKAKRSLMKFLRMTADPEALSLVLENHGHESLADFLGGQYGIPPQLQAALNALTLSPNSPAHTLTSFALPRITRHLSSIGVFGPGFGSVIPKWGLSEIAQVGCRACAVGGGVYMLGQGIETISKDRGTEMTTLTLQGGETAITRWAAGCGHDIPSQIEASGRVREDRTTPCVARMISIVSSSLQSLFPPIADGAPPAACTVVVIPAGSLEDGGSVLSAPIYLMVHSNDTGECPVGQSVIYSSINIDGPEGLSWLRKAMQVFIESLTDQTKPDILWTMEYMQPSTASSDPSLEATDNIIILPETNLDLAFDDSMLQGVRSAWHRISNETNGFLAFEDREIGAYDEDD